MDFGICFKGDMDPHRTVRLARQAEAGGFTYGWTFDSHVLWKDAVGMLSLLAWETERMYWGPLVTNVAVRALDVTASWLATLNIVSRGRAVCAVGRGDSSRRVLGHPPTTIQTMMEGIEIIRDLAEGRERELDGVKVRLSWIDPAYRLPIWIAGYGPRVLRAAARSADGIILQIAEPSLCRWFIQQVEAGAREAGRDPREIQYLVAAPVFISEDIEQCRAQVRWFPAMVGNHIADLIRNHAIGVPQALLDAIQGRKSYDYRHHADKDAGHLEWVTSAVVDSFSLIGTVQSVIDKLKELEAVGINQFVIYLMCEEEERIVEAFAREIIPALNQ